MNGVEGYSGYLRGPGADRIADRVLSRLDADRSGGQKPEEVAGSKLEQRIGDRYANVDGNANGDASKPELSGVASSRGSETPVAPGQSQVAAVLESLLAELQASPSAPDASPSDENGGPETRTQAEDVDETAIADEARADAAAETSRTEAAGAAVVAEDPAPRDDVVSGSAPSSDPVEQGRAAGPSSNTLTDLAQALYSDVQSLFDEVT